MVRLFLTVFLIFTCSFLSKATSLSSLKFERFLVEDGLSQGSILSMHQDKKGFLWLGTEDGLNRFDGYEFYQYRAKGLHGRNIKAIASDNDGNLWVGTTDGLNVMLAGEETFVHFTSENTISLTNDNITKIFLSSSGTLWVGSEDGLFAIKMNQIDNQISIEATKINDKPLNVGAIEEVRPNILWVGSRVGIIEFNTENMHSKVIKAKKANQQLDVMRIFKTSNNEIWVASYWRGIYKYNSKGEELAHYTTKSSPAIVQDSVYDFAEDNLGRIWVGFSYLGVMIFEDNDFHLLTNDSSNPESLSADAIETLLKDKDGNMWVGTTRAGLNRHRLITETFSHLRKSSNEPMSLLSKDIRALLVDNENKLWVGNAGKGISILDFKNSNALYITSEDGLAGINIDTIIQGSEHYIWAGSNAGLTKINPESNKVEAVYTMKNSGLKYGQIANIIDDFRGFLWISHWGAGLSKFNKNTGQAMLYQAKDGAIPSNIITDFTLDSTDTLWLTSSAGLSEYLPKSNTFKTYQLHPTGKQHYFESMTLEADGFMWLPSQNGLYAFDVKNKKYVDLALPSILKNESVHEVSKDLNGNYWASTNNGLIRFQKNNSDFIQFQSRHGLQSNEFNGGASAKFNDGKLAFGGVNGVSIFMPDDVAKIASSIRITGIRLDTKAEGASKNYKNNIPKKLLLLPDTLSLSVSFSSLNFSHPSDTKYSYRILGIDKSWVPTKENTVTIPQLASGKYQLEIKATNTFGEWENNIAALEFEFLPPWYKHKLAYLMYFLLCLSLLYAIYRLKVSSIRKYSVELETLVNQRTKELSDKNTQFEKQANALATAIKDKTRLYETVSHELRTPITLILGPIQQLRKKITDKELIATTTLIERNALRLNRLTNQLLDLSRSEAVMTEVIGKTDISALAKSIASSFKPYSVDANIDLISRYDNDLYVNINHEDMEKVISNLLSNAIKYNKQHGSVTLDIKKKEGSVIITVADTGVGINHQHLSEIFTRFYRVDSEQSTTIEGCGIGLSIVKSIIEKANGTIDVKSEAGEGTTFTLTLPICNEKNHERQTVAAVKLTEAEDNNLRLNSNTPQLLLIDDNEDMLTYLSSVLSDNYKITTASNGQEGIKVARAIIPDIIISDVMMPGIDGLELLDTLKSDELTNHIPIILLTAKGSNKSKIEGLKLRADDYISKPFTEDELSLRLRNILDAKDILKKKLSAELMLEPQSLVIKEKPAFIVKLDNIIEKRYQDSSFSVAELAIEAAVGERQLLRKLKATADVGAKEYIRSYRLKKAAELLHQGNTATIVATEVGFSSSAYFSSCFKAFYGLTPSQYINSTTPTTPSTNNDAR